MNGTKKIFHFLKKGWLFLGATLILFVMLEGGARVYYAIRNHPRFNTRAMGKAGSNSAFYPDNEALDQIYSVEFQNSGSLVWKPYLYWRRLPFYGRFITVDEHGLRQTYNETSEQNAKTKIFFFGGSALWGTGARDDFTIPSFVSKRLSREGIQDFHVFNFGEHGYVSTQELIALVLELQRGNRPDIVIFYDGVNDLFSTYQNHMAGIPQNEVHRHEEFNQHDHVNWSRFLRQHFKLIMGLLNLRDKLFRGNVIASQRDLDIKDLVAQTLDVYQRNIEIIQALSCHYDFETYFFWQPTVWSKEKLVLTEKHQTNYSYGNFYRITHREIATSHRVASMENFYDLSDIFDQYANRVFIDSWHLLENGNRIVADAIAELLLTKSKKFVR